MVVNQLNFVTHFNSKESIAGLGAFSQALGLLLAALPVSVVSCTVLHALNERVKGEHGA